SGHFNFGAKRGFSHGDGNGELNVVARASENRIGTRAHDEEEIAGGAAVDACVAFALQADALAIARAGLDAEVDGFSARNDALAVAGGAVILDVTGSVATG